MLDFDASELVFGTECRAREGIEEIGEAGEEPQAGAEFHEPVVGDIYNPRQNIKKTVGKDRIWIGGRRLGNEVREFLVGHSPLELHF